MRVDKDSKKFTGSALEKALAEKQFERPAIQLVGMVKSSEKQEHIAFAPAGCESWVDVPSAMIEEAENLGHQPCNGHSHPVFRLSLHEPTDPMAKVLMGLLVSALHPRQRPAVGAAPERIGGGLPGGLGPREVGRGSSAQIINDRAGLDRCHAMCFMEASPGGMGRCTKMCDCVHWDGKNVVQCWAEIYGARASAFER